MKQTAVQWLFLMLNNPNRDQEFANKLLEKAIEMEKEQIVNAFEYIDFNLDDGRHYYEQTYETKTN